MSEKLALPQCLIVKIPKISVIHTERICISLQVDTLCVQWICLKLAWKQDKLKEKEKENWKEGESMGYL